MHFLGLLQLLAAIFPIVHQAIGAAEVAFPAAGAGAQKLDHAVKIVEAAIPAITSTVNEVAALKAAIPGLISGTVQAVNAGAGAERRTGAKDRRVAQAVKPAPAAALFPLK